MTLAIRLGSTLVPTRLPAREMLGAITIASRVLTILTLMSDRRLRSNIARSPGGADSDFPDSDRVVLIVCGAVLWAVPIRLGQMRNVRMRQMSQLSSFRFMVAVGMAALSAWAQEAGSPASVLTLTGFRYR